MTHRNESDRLRMIAAALERSASADADPYCPHLGAAFQRLHRRQRETAAELRSLASALSSSHPNHELDGRVHRAVVAANRQHSDERILFIRASGEDLGVGD